MSTSVEHSAHIPARKPKPEPPLEPGGDRAERRRLNLGMENFSGVYVLALLIVVFSIALQETFPTSQTLRSVADNYAITAILALALVIPMAAGAFDLSVAALLGFTVTVVAWMQSNDHGAVASIGAGLLVGILVGAINGGVVVKLRVNSFIATLGMSSILAAGSYWVTDGRPIVSGFDSTFLEAGRNDLLQIPLPVWYLVLIAALLWFVTEHTPLGRYFYASGGNAQAARLAGVRVDRMVFYSLVISGALAALAGIILTAKLGVADPTLGPPYLLPAFSAAFLGATQIKNGRVNVLGTLVAVYLLATGVKGLQLAGAPLWVDNLFNGTALIVAVALAASSSRRSE